MNRRWLLFLMIAAALAPPTFAAADPFQIDAAHTNVVFKVKHMGVSLVAGSFVDVSGTLDWEGNDPSTAKVDITARIASINTRNAKRDDHLRSPDFFDAEKFPTMTFKSTKIEKTGEGTAKMTGDLTIKGVTQSVTFDVTHNGTLAKDPWGNERAGFSAKAVIDRHAFHVTAPKVSDAAIGDGVTIEIETEFVRPAK